MNKINSLLYYVASFAILLSMSSCTDWLNPKPLSFYTPENAFTSYQGLKTGTDMLNRDVRYVEFYPTALSQPPAFLTEMFFSDMAVNGMTDTNASAQDLNNQITPTANLNTAANAARCEFYWKSFYKGIKDANTIITRAEKVEYDSPEKKDEILGLGYFHRALRYYRLVHQFGDVPFLVDEITGPRYDFFSTKREVILRHLKDDLDRVVENMPKVTNKGTVTQGAVYHLLTKINLALGEFDDAIKSASKVIDGGVHSLMTERFGIDKNKTDKNVIWDLHRSENKALKENTEVLYLVVDRFATEAATPVGTEIMRNATPWIFATNQIKTPDGKAGFVDNDEKKNPFLLQYGRGIGTLRNTWYHQHTIWDGLGFDLRHDRESGNWVDMEDLKYNNPSLEGTQWYGKNLEKGATQVTDTIRDWYAWPHYKVFVPEQRTASWRGGNSDWYIFRLAETYLLRAEAYLWKGDKENAAKDINIIRRRAQAKDIPSSEVNMRVLIDERGRELFYEEPRKTELTRISYLYAKTGQTAPNGKTYNLENFHLENFFYDHIMETTDFYNKGVTTAKGNTYTISPYHVLWPVPENSILSNTQARINQNLGYRGAEKNVEPSDYPN